MPNDNIKGPYILWENNGCDGWSPRSFATLVEALTAPRYSSDFELTKKVVLESQEDGSVVVR